MNTVIVRWLGTQAYLLSWKAMQQFTNARQDQTLDEIWFVEHPPVFTQGQNGKSEHILQTTHIPIVNTDRGGQITYHGPGQLMVYLLLDLRRKKLNIRQLVSALEQSIIDLLAEWQIVAYAKREAPGIYVAEKKIGSIGLRVRRGCTYHGIAFNVNMDLTPFSHIHPCGFPNLKMTQLKEFIPDLTVHEVGQKLINYLMKNLMYTSANIKNCLDQADGYETHASQATGS